MKISRMLLLVSSMFLLRIGCSYFIPSHYPDSASYLTIASNVAHGQGYGLEPGVPSFVREPAYPLLIALSFRLFGNDLYMLLIIQALLGALTCYLVYLLARQLFDPHVALVAFWVSGLYPVLIAYTGMFLTETLFTFLLIAGVLSLVCAINRGKKKYFFFAGALLGAANLTRPEAILLFALLLILTVTALRPIRKGIVGSLFMLTAFLMIISPWMVYKYRVSRYVLSAQCGGIGAVAWYTAHCAIHDCTPESDEQLLEELQGIIKSDTSPAINKRLGREAARIIAHHPAEYARRLSSRFISLWVTSHSSIFGITASNSEYLNRGKYLLLGIKSLLLLLQISLLFLAACGLYGSWRLSLPYAVVLLSTLFSNFYIFIDYSSRHHVPYLPFFMIFASFAMVSIIRKARHSSGASHVIGESRYTQ